MEITFPEKITEQIDRVRYEDFTSSSTNLYDIQSGERVQTQDANSGQLKILDNANIPISYQYINRIVRMLNDVAINLGYVRKDYGAKNEGYFQDIGIVDGDDRFLQNNISVVDNLINLEDLLLVQHYGYASDDDKFGRNKSSWHKDIKQDNLEVLDDVILNENALTNNQELLNLQSITDYGLKVLDKSLFLNDIVVGNREDNSANYSSLFIVNDNLEYVGNDLHINADKKIYFGSTVSSRGVNVSGGNAYISKYNEDLAIATNNSVFIDIDKDNNANVQKFRITHNNMATTLLEVIEDGNISINAKRQNFVVKDGTSVNLFSINNTTTSGRQGSSQVSGVNTKALLNGYMIVAGTDGTSSAQPLITNQNNPAYNIFDVGLEVEHTTYLKGDLHVQSGSSVVLPHTDDVSFRDDDTNLSTKMMIFSMIFG